MHTGRGKTACASMLLSGTASGVMGASFLASRPASPMRSRLDIGGTSADVALVIGGRTAIRHAARRWASSRSSSPPVSVTSIGDGGGSIAAVDEFGVLKVGPESAGSTPGPACYGRGGERATITDAMAVCGFLGHSPIAYSAVAIDLARAEAAVAATWRRNWEWICDANRAGHRSGRRLRTCSSRSTSSSAALASIRATSP